MIKQIQLRGISCTPSDRMTTDGGCAESLNVEIDTNELAPMLPPEDITEAEGLPLDMGYEVVYIHKTNQYTNYILWDRESNALGVWGKDNEDGRFESILDLKEEEDIVVGITSLGNTLIVTTSQEMYYILYDLEEYRNLGSDVPTPVISFSVGSPAEKKEDYDIYAVGYSTDYAMTNYFYSPLVTGASGGMMNKIPVDAFSSVDNALGYKEDIKESILGLMKRLATDSDMPYPHEPYFIRYAVKLKGGGYTKLSVPILMGAGYKDIYTVRLCYGRRNAAVSAESSIFVRFNYADMGSPNITLEKFDYQGWEDIIEGIDIFASVPLRVPFIHYDTPESTELPEVILSGQVVTDDRDREWRNVEITPRNISMEEELLKLQNFYKVASFVIRDEKFDDRPLVSEITGYALNIPKQTELVNNGEELEDDYLSNHSLVGEGVSVYNNRLILEGAQIRLSSGYGALNANVYKEDFSEDFIYRFKYYVKYSMRAGEDGESPNANYEGSVIGRFFDSEEFFFPKYRDQYNSDSFERYTQFEAPYAWIAYPDPRCYRAELEAYRKNKDGNYQLYGVRKLIMKPHPSLNCAYYFGGLNAPLYEVADLDPEDYGVESGGLITGENKYMKESNKLYLSDIDNPFSFPLENRYYFIDPILGVAFATKALSTGQFGQYPLYVFTEGGIWAMEIGNTGNFTSSKPLSREVCTSPKSITMIDQAIVFLTKKGLMLMQGSDIVSISPFMNGRHYAISEDIDELLEGTEWDSLRDTLKDEDHFLKFMEDASIVYDYTGKRLICISESNPQYQYVYKLDSQTWHKMSMAESNVTINHVLNSYPDAVISARVGNHNRLINFSTVLDVDRDSQIRTKGVIITRPFNLEHPDIRKVIKQIKMRGQFNKADVKYILLSSDDDINWHIETSLRRHSSKLFRLVILVDFSPTERLSYVDIDFDTRFTNKLR